MYLTDGLFCFGLPSSQQAACQNRVRLGILQNIFLFVCLVWVFFDANAARYAAESCAGLTFFVRCDNFCQFRADVFCQIGDFLGFFYRNIVIPATAVIPTKVGI